MSILKHLTIQNALSEFIELGGADAKVFGILISKFFLAPVQPAFASPDLQRLAQYASAIGQMYGSANQNKAVSRVASLRSMG